MSHPEPPFAGTEIDTVIGSLERQRATFRWKAGGLDADGLRATTAASTMTLGGLLKHLALVEDEYFSVRLFGNDPAPPWSSVDDPWRWCWTSAGGEDPDELYALYDTSVERSRELLTAALDDGGLDRPWDLTFPDGTRPTLRRLLADLVEEYARHTGHADILREAVDGLVGEDPPD